jgi:AcrR family transcriptional regulator
MFKTEDGVKQVLSRRERKKLETRQGLLEAALELFREKGYDEATVEEITERADVAKGTFFNYFASKEALLSELAAWKFSQLREALDVRQGAPESPVARIKLLVRLLHEQTFSDWHLFQRAFATRLGKLPPPPHQARRQLTGLVADLVREAQACGEIRADVEPELVSDLMFIAHIRRLVACFREGGIVPPADDSEQVIDLLMDGLAGPNWQK